MGKETIQSIKEVITNSLEEMSKGYRTKVINKITLLNTMGEIYEELGTTDRQRFMTHLNYHDDEDFKDEIKKWIEHYCRRIIYGLM